MLISSRFFWISMVFAVTFLLILLLYRQFFREKGYLPHKIYLALYAMYLGALFVLILFPTYMLRPFRFTTERVTLIPFRFIHRLRTDPIEPIGNLLLFVPFGFFSVLNDHVKAGRRLLNVLWRTALVSASMEIMQMFIGRVTDIDDVIINTAGGMIGGLICVIWHKTRLDHTPIGEKLMPELPKRWRGRLAIPLLSVIMLVCYGVGLFSANAIATRYTGEQCIATINGSTVRFEIGAEYAMLWDCADEKPIFEMNADAAIYPASAIKLAACLTTLDVVDPDDPVSIGSELLQVSFDSSRAGIAMGSVYTVRELLGGILLSGGADASYALAVHCGKTIIGDPEASADQALQAYIDAANAKLQSIGAVNTTMRDVVGLDNEEQLTTVNDLRRIASAVLADPVLSDICARSEMEIGPEDARIVLKNTNKLVCADSEFYSDAFIGIRTGSTSRAGNCLIGAFVKDGRQYITIIMHSGYNEKFTDTLTLASIV